MCLILQCIVQTLQTQLCEVFVGFFFKYKSESLLELTFLTFP